MGCKNPKLAKIGGQIAFEKRTKKIATGPKGK
jgi:hypothetical protein